MQSRTRPRLARRGRHGEQHHLRRALIGCIVLERYRGGLARGRNDFHPLVDQHTGERLAEVQRRLRVHDQRELARRHRVVGIGGQPDPALAFDVRQLGDSEAQRRAGTHDFRRLQARTEARHRLAHALHLPEPRIHGERIAALQRRGRSERFRELRRVGQCEARQGEKTVAEHSAQHLQRRRRTLRALDAPLRFLRYRCGLREHRIGCRRDQRRRPGNTEAAQCDDRSGHWRHVASRGLLQLGCERGRRSSERLLCGLRTRVELGSIDARVERSLQAREVARVERPHAREQLPRPHRELRQLIEPDLRRLPGRIALPVDAQGLAGSERSVLLGARRERPRIDLGRRIASSRAAPDRPRRSAGWPGR